jgi:hypothetical protein
MSAAAAAAVATVVGLQSGRREDDKIPFVVTIALCFECCCRFTLHLALTNSAANPSLLP